MTTHYGYQCLKMSGPKGVAIKNFAKAGRPSMALYAVSKSTTSKEIFSVLKLLGEPNVKGRETWPIGLAEDPGTIP